MKTEEIEKLFHELKNSFETGTIGEKEFQKEIRDLFFQDPQGNYWTVGAKTEEWYRYEDGDWIQDSPPPTLEPVRQEIRPPGMEYTPTPPSTKSRFGNRILFGMAGFLVLLCFISVALVSYQLGRLSVTPSSVQPTSPPSAAMTRVSTTEATPSAEAGIFTPSPIEPGAMSTPLPTTTQEEASPPTPTRAPSPTPRATRARQPTAAPMPTPEMRYGPPVLKAPQDGAQFGPGYDAILEWESVAQLAEDEYYDVQVCWNSRSECWGQYQQGTSWTFPSFKRGAAIDERYFWHVTVRVQVADTRNGPADPPVSPESETWMFLLTE